LNSSNIIVYRIHAPTARSSVELTASLQLGYVATPDALPIIFPTREPLWMSDPTGADSIEQRDAAAVDADAPAPSFEQAMQELESLVSGMESGELSLEQSLAAYRRGAYLLRVCQGALQDAQQQVKILEDGLLRDFQVGNEQE